MPSCPVAIPAILTNTILPTPIAGRLIECNLGQSFALVTTSFLALGAFFDRVSIAPAPAAVIVHLPRVEALLRWPGLHPAFRGTRRIRYPSPWASMVEVRRSGSQTSPTCAPGGLTE